MTLEDELTQLFDELADSHAVGPRPPLGRRSVIAQTAPPGRSWVPVGLAAAACVAVLVAGLVVVAGRDAGPAASDRLPGATPVVSPTSTPAAGLLSNPPGGAVLLAPATDSDVFVQSVQNWDRSGVAAGAVVSPDGTVFGITISAGATWLPDHPDWESIPADRRGLDTIAGRQIAAVVDATAPTQIYRTVSDDCWSIEITSAGTAMWTADVDTLIGAITTNRDVQPEDEAAVTIDIPDGWTSLGGGRMLQSWTMALEVELDGATHQVHLAQVPDAPVGVLMSGESNPKPFDHNGQQWWAVDIVTTPGVTSVIGDAGLGALHITSDLPAAQLVQIIDSLVPTSSDELVAPSRAPADSAVPDQAVDESTTDIATSGTGPSATTCGTLGTGLDLIDP